MVSAKSKLSGDTISFRSYRAMPPASQSSNFYSQKPPFQNDFAWIRYVMYGCSIIFLLVGVLTLVVGSWLRLDSRFRDFLSERYRNVVEEAFYQAPTLYIFSYILIVLGALMVVVCMFGCCGIVTYSTPILVLYCIMTVFLMVSTLSAGIYLIFKKDGIDVEVSDALTYMVQHYYQGPGIIQESLDRLQQTFRCCGNSGCGDFRVFRLDPPRSCDIRCDGCHHRILVALQIGFSVAVAVFSIVIFAQFVAIVLCLLLVMKRDNRNFFTDHQYELAYLNGNYSRPAACQHKRQRPAANIRSLRNDYVRHPDPEIFYSRSHYTGRH